MGNETVGFEGYWPVIQKVAVLRQPCVFIQDCHFRQKDALQHLAQLLMGLCPSSLETASNSAVSFLPYSVNST